MLRQPVDGGVDLADGDAKLPCDGARRGTGRPQLDDLIVTFLTLRVLGDDLVHDAAASALPSLPSRSAQAHR